MSSRSNNSPMLPKKMSPYNSSYPAELLSNGIKVELERAQMAAERIYDCVLKELPIAVQLKQAMRTGSRYVVDASEDTLKAIEDGILKLTQENGKTYAQLKVNGKYGSKLPIKKEVFKKGIDANQMANALQMQALQEQLQNVEDQLLLIGGSVKEVLQGQQNDRIGLYYSGLSLFLESQHILNEELKKSVEAQALRALTEATFQLKISMQSDIQYIEAKEYDKFKGKRKELIISHMNSINRAFAFIYQATLLRAGIYCNIGEQAAMAQVLDEYSLFIENDIVPYAALLAQYDLNDDGTENGLWAARTQLKLDTTELYKILNDPPKTLYLGVKKEKTENEESEGVLE